jgi:adenylate cyclase
MIDDSLAVCKRVRDIFSEDKGIVFEFCTDPTKAIEIAEHFSPTVILQDLHMPGVDGFDLLRAYRNNPALANVPVLMLSAEKDQRIRSKSFSLGANDYLLKESNNAEFVARVKYHAKRYNDLRGTLTSRPLTSPSAHTIKVLMIDSSKFACSIVSKELSKEKDILFTACYERGSAIEVADAVYPTIILISIAPDEVDAGSDFSFLRALRNNPSTKDVPIVFLSGFDDADLKARALASGANDYVVKSSNWAELVSRIRRHSNEYFNILHGAADYRIPATGRGPTKVLMIDDSMVICKSIANMLDCETNVTFSYCTDPLQAVDNAKIFSPTVILQDLEMPGKNGLELLRDFREEPATRDVPIIILSGVKDPAVKANAFALGANDYVEKKMDKIELLSRIQYHTKGYLNSLALNEALQELLETRKRLGIHADFIRRTFGRYLSDEIVHSILETPGGLNLGGETREISVMMADLRGFTSLGERLAPEKVLAIINNYLRVMTDILIKYNGTIDEFIGDAILAIFGAPVQRENDAKRAVACALEMQLAMSMVNDWNRREGYPNVAMGIGINSGEAVVGNIGSEKRSKYGIVGRNVNLASRIESYTVGGQILIAESTVKACGPIVDVDDEMEVMPKGVKEPIRIYSVRGIGGEFEIHLPEKKKVRLKSLARPWPVRFNVLEGKHAGKETHEGTIMKMGGMIVEIKAGLAPEKLSNLKLTLFDEESREFAAPIYGKVVETDSDSPSTFKVNLTSVTPETERLLEMAGSSRVYPQVQ